MLKKYVYGICMECHEVIYNPICPSCLSTEIRKWLEDTNFRMKKPVVSEMQSILNRGRCFGSSCVICRKQSTFLCPYCFTELVYKKLKQLKIAKKILLDFLKIFNFDFEHTGYYHDLEKLEEQIKY